MKSNGVRIWKHGYSRRILIGVKEILHSLKYNWHVKCSQNYKYLNMVLHWALICNIYFQICRMQWLNYWNIKKRIQELFQLVFWVTSKFVVAVCMSLKTRLRTDIHVCSVHAYTFWLGRSEYGNLKAGEDLP